MPPPFHSLRMCEHMPSVRYTSDLLSIRVAYMSTTCAHHRYTEEDDSDDALPMNDIMPRHAHLTSAGLRMYTCMDWNSARSSSACGAPDTEPADTHKGTS